MRLSVSDLGGTRDCQHRHGHRAAGAHGEHEPGQRPDPPARPPSTATSTRTGWPPPPWFQYGPSTGYGSATPATPAGADTRPVPVTAPVSLAPNTTYHYRALASNGAGSSVGADSTFTTYGPPAATTGGASGLTATAWTLGGMVDANGLDATAWFEYGTTTDYGSQTVQDVAGNTGYNVAVNATVGGLAPNTTYHYRLVVRNSSGLAYGTDRTFTTFGPPAATTGGAIGVTASSASLTGQRGPERSGHYLPRRVGPDDRIRLDVNVAQRRFGDVGRHGVGGHHWPRLPPALPLPDRRHQQRRHHLQRGPHGQQPVINGCASVPPGSVVDGAVSSDGEVVLGRSFVLGRQRVGGQGWDRVVSAGVHDVAEGERPAGVE